MTLMASNLLNKRSKFGAKIKIFTLFSEIAIFVLYFI